ncbi:MAG: MaoC family dehydratase [Pseudomonadota bacterium]
MKDILHFEDFAEGQSFDCGERTLTEEEMIAFSRRYDPLPFHVDREAARASLLGGLAASGWHTCALMMRMYAEAVILRTAGLGSPGVSEVRWRKPVYANVPMRLRCDVTGSRPSGSRPDAGLVSFEFTLSAPEHILCTQSFVVLIARRSPGGASSARAVAKKASLPEKAPERIAPGSEMTYVDPADAPVGVAFDLGSEEITAEAIVDFAQQFDPQPFHLDREAGRASLFGGLAASGWHTTAVWMGRMSAAHQAAMATLPAEVQTNAHVKRGPSPGFEDLRWRRPVLEGDTLRCFSMPLEVRDLNSMPDWGLLLMRNWAENQRGEIAMSFTGKLLLRRG